MSGRKRAVADAKDLSRRRGLVHVHRSDRVVEMSFIRGDLVSYRFETGRRH